MSMTFVQIQNAVLADRFRESQRSDCKQWINHRYAWIWALEEWTFAEAVSATPVPTANQRVLASVPADFGQAISLLNASGRELTPMADMRAFYARYGDGAKGDPEAYTVVGSAIHLGPIPQSTSTCTLVYRKEPTALAGDSDVPALPEGFHFALVHGAAAEGLKLQNDPTWQAFEQDFQASITTLQRRFVQGIRASEEQFGAHRPDLGWG